MNLTPDLLPPSLPRRAVASLTVPSWEHGKIQFNRRVCAARNQGGEIEVLLEYGSRAGWYRPAGRLILEVYREDHAIASRGETLETNP